jgi:hypothetical protein
VRRGGGRNGMKKKKKNQVKEESEGIEKPDILADNGEARGVTEGTWGELG